jgi:heptosyltransferase I
LTVAKQAPSNLQRICLVRLSALGDVCLTVPLVRALQKAFPQARLTWVTTRAMLGLLEGLEGVEFVLMEKANHPFAYWKFYQQMKHRSFDVLLAAQASFRAHFLYPLIRAPRKIGFARSEARDSHGWFVNEHVPGGRDHLLDSFMKFAQALGVERPAVEWGLPIAAADRSFAEERLPGERWVAVNPMASKPERTWPPKRYAAVIEACAARWNCNVVLTGAPSRHEEAFAAQVAARLPEPRRLVTLVGQTTPKQLAAVLARAKVLVAPDTGPVHIATAMGTPVVGLYAVAPPELSGPYHSQHLVVNRFPDAVRTILGKDPRKVPWKTRVKSRRAMALITVDDVLEKLETALAERNVPAITRA